MSRPWGPAPEPGALPPAPSLTEPCYQSGTAGSCWGHGPGLGAERMLAAPSPCTAGPWGSLSWTLVAPGGLSGPLMAPQRAPNGSSAGP